MNSKLILAVACFVLIQFYYVDFAAACPTCKLGLHGDTALGYAISILFMMSMPFTIFSFWVVTILRLRRR